MRVLSLSLDAQVLNSKSVVAVRTRTYGDAVETYTVLVPAPATQEVVLTPKVTVYGVHSFSKLSTLVQLFLYVRKLWKTTKFDLVTTQDSYFLGLLGVILSRHHGCALEVQAHGVEKDSSLRRILARFVYKRAHVVRTVSSRLKKVLIETYGVQEKKIIVVPVHVDVSSLGFGTKEHIVKTDALKLVSSQKFNICMVGRLVTVKNVPLALRVLARFSKSYPETHLHIVGEGGLCSSLEKLADTLGIRDLVTFHGEKRGLELGALYSACDVFLHTADSEGYGMVLIEALHAGLPIVTTDVGCVGDIIRESENALVVSVGGEDALLRALTRLHEEPTLAEAFQTASRNALSQLPTFDVVVATYKKIWETAIAMNKKSG